MIVDRLNKEGKELPALLKDFKVNIDNLEEANQIKEKIAELLVNKKIEPAMAKKLEAAEGLPADVVKREVFGEQFTTICSGGACLSPALLDYFKNSAYTNLVYFR